MLWLKSLHIVFVVCWFAGIFYLPRLFVYHAMAEDSTGRERFKVMERKLYRGIMTPCAVLAVLFGAWMMIASWESYARAGWLHAKLLLVAVLVGYHVYCGRMVKAFAGDRNPHSHTFYRYFNEAPLALLIGIVILAVVRPF
jgi:putative membrane protein